MNCVRFTICIDSPYDEECSPETAGWLYVFKPRVADTTLYVKLVLRARCVVISFHGEESNNEYEDEIKTPR